MSTFELASIGGLISFLSTGLGSVLTPLLGKWGPLKKIQLSMDFALGVMLSAVAFSLVGPELIKGKEIFLSFGGLIIGSVFILFSHHFIEKIDHKLLLIATLILHNFPEGMGAGASLGGMNLQDALPLQLAISIQNIMEGLLLTILFQSLGIKMLYAVLLGLGSGLIEMGGAIIAGIVLEETISYLPFFLTLAGGAMMMSVLLEIKETLLLKKRFSRAQFVAGLMVIPLMNAFTF